MENVEYKVRRAEPGDIPAIMSLLVQVNMVHHNGRPDLFKGPCTKYTAEELREIFADDSTPVFVYEDGDGTVCGHAFCMIKQLPDDNILTDIKTLYIDDICIDEKYRGRHIGTAICRHVTEYAKEIGCYNVTLNVWSLNTGAMRFYESFGFRPQKVGMEIIL